MKLTTMQRAKLLWHEVKQASMRFFMGIRWSLHYRSAADSEADSSVGEGRNSSLILACLGTLITAFLEPRLRVVQLTKDGSEEVVGHPLTRLLRRPNPYYSGLLMWTATLMDYFLTGNAYWIKVRDGSGLLIELWWVPSYMIEPKWPDGTTIFLSHYDYTPNASQDPIRYEIGDIVHFRNGIDPSNPRKGLSALGSLLRLVFTDDEAIRYQATVLRNGGAPGIVLAPAAGGKITDPDRIKAEFEARTSGDNRGRPLVLSNPVTVQVTGYSPAEMNLDKLQRMPETRVAAVFGTPAVIVGLMAGLDKSTYNNMSEAREHLYEGTVIPKHNFFKEELWAQVLPEFGPNDTVDVEWDYSNVRVLQEDRDKLYIRVINAWVSGVISQNQAKKELGYPATDTGEVYAIPGKVKIVKEEDIGTEPEPVPTALEDDEFGDTEDDEIPEGEDDEIPEDEAKAYPIGKKQADIAGYFSLVNLMHADTIGQELGGYLRQQRDTVISRYRDSVGKTAGPVETKVSIGQLLPFNENARTLRGLMTKWYVRVADDVHTVVQDALAMVYELPADELEEYTRQAGYYVTGITRTTRNDVAKILRASLREKWTVDQTTDALYNAAAFSHDRAMMVARTELGSAANLAAIVSFENSGRVESVTVHDGDQDAVCNAWNGRVVPMESARAIPRLAHPNCTRSFSPVLSKAAALPAESRNGRELVHA